MLKIMILCIGICCFNTYAFAQRDSSKTYKEAGYFIAMGTGTAFLHDQQRAIELCPQIGFYVKNFILVSLGIPYLFDYQTNRLQERIIGGRLSARLNLFRLSKHWTIPAVAIYTLQEMEIASLYSNLVTQIDGSVVRVLLCRTIHNYTNFHYNTGLGFTTRFGSGFSLWIEGLVNMVPHKKEHLVYGSPFAARAGIYYGF